MLIELSQQAYHFVSPLFQPLRHHLAIQSIMLGMTPARVFVDDESQPTCALIWYGHRYLLSGALDNMAFNASLARFFAHEVIPHELEHDIHWMSLYYAPGEWGEVIEKELLPGRQATMAPRQYYAHALTVDEPTVSQDQIPADFELRPIDAALVNRTDLQYLDILREEMCSERPSVSDFLDRSFGLCLIRNNVLAGWCLSEYNCAGRCEIGIETRPPFQRRGLGTLMTRAFIDAARTKGITDVGWHCWTRAHNVSSAATALRAGLQLVCDYPAHLVRIKD